MNTKSLSGLRTLFLVHFFVGLVFGILYLLLPGAFLAAMKWPAPDTLPYRTIGAAVLAFTASSWLCYQNCVWEKVKIVVQAEIVWTALAALVNVYGILVAGMPAAGWIDVVMMAGFAVAFAYFYAQLNK